MDRRAGDARGTPGYASSAALGGQSPDQPGSDQRKRQDDGEERHLPIFEALAAAALDESMRGWVF
jgi:hypothetical protein